MDKIYGVNLGNWLVLEKWMGPGLFAGTKAEDETDLCLELPVEKHLRLKKHRDTYITYEDFASIKQHGLNTVRLPVPHFIFGDCEPYVGCIEYLDKAFDCAHKAGLKILIDLHTAPDSQNGFDNGGICGVCKWHTKQENIDRTLMVLEKLAARYKDHPALFGIQLLNEPASERLFINTRKNYIASDPERAVGSCAVPISVLFDFYTRGYEVIRRHLDENRTVMFHDGFRLKLWKDFMQGPEYKNIILDTHLYVGMGLGDEQPKGTRNELVNYLRLALSKYMEDVIEMQEYFPVVIGEWCIAHYPSDMNDFTPVQKQYSYRAVADTQLFAWERAAGWFFWSYKLLADVPGWDLRECIRNGWLPHNFQSGQ